MDEWMEDGWVVFHTAAKHLGEMMDRQTLSSGLNYSADCDNVVIGDRRWLVRVVRTSMLGGSWFSLPQLISYPCLWVCHGLAGSKAARSPGPAW